MRQQRRPFEARTARLRLTTAAAGLVAGVAAVLLVAGCARPVDGPHVGYLPTPEPVVAAMLSLARVSATDVVYDLGSGDGRVVVAAARDFGARAVGVELEPALLRQSRDAALRAGIADRALFLRQDLFGTDLRDATVVTLFLRDDLNLRLRGKLLRELRPGARVVSHWFGMGDWAPDETRRVPGVDREHDLHLWTVPGAVDGVWRLTLDGASATLEVRQRFQGFTATLVDGAGARHDVEDGAVRGPTIAFTARGAAPPRVLRFDGRLRGDVLAGTVTGPDAPARPWSARRAR
jgi:SAM-dependent methyltransferase